MRATAAGSILVLIAACSQVAPPVPGAAASPATSGCMAGSEGRLQAEVRGALRADIDWTNDEMECDGGPRPDGAGLRVTIAGPLMELPSTDADSPGVAASDAVPRRLRFIFGIDLTDTASGPAQMLPTNLTVIVEDENLLFTTQGDARCAVEDLARTPLGGEDERVAVRGYCLGPASDLAGGKRVLVPTFSFTALVHGADAQATDAQVADAQ